MIHTAGLLDPTPYLEHAGPWALVIVGAIILIETGLLFPFLPGDSLIFVAAMLAPTLGLPLWTIIVTVAVAAIIGDSIGYAIGGRFGRGLFKPEARVFKTVYLHRAEEFFGRYGPQSLVLARFAPIVRTFVPPVVGAARMPYRRFLLWNVIGGVAWAVLFSLAGHFLGKIPVVAKNVEIIAIAIVVISVIPILTGVLKDRGNRKREHAE